MAIKNARVPKQVDFPAKDMAQLGSYVIFADPIYSTQSTGEAELFNLPAGTLVESISWECIDAWSDSQLPANQPVILIGSTADKYLYGQFGQAQLGSSDKSGSFNIHELSTGQSKIAAYIVTQGTNPAPLQGQLNVWLTYRPNAEAQVAIADS